MGKLFIIKDGYGVWYTNQHCSHPHSSFPDGSIAEDIEEEQHLVHREGERAVKFLGTSIMTTIPEQYLQELTTSQPATPLPD